MPIVKASKLTFKNRGHGRRHLEPILSLKVGEAYLPKPPIKRSSRTSLWISANNAKARTNNVYSVLTTEDGTICVVRKS